MLNVNATEVFQDPEVAALSVLDAMHHGQHYDAPIDPVLVARHLGINVWGNQHLEQNLSGMIAKLDPAPGAEVDIVVNVQHNPNRQRFTIAHELGHYFHVLKDNPELEGTLLNKRDDRSSCGTYSEEIYSNKFAASLLMPRPLVEEYIERGYNLIQLASVFQVSLQAMTLRIENLKLKVYG